MKCYLTLLFLLGSNLLGAQYYHSHFQLDGAASFTPSIYTSAPLPNGNIAYGVHLYDSTVFNPGATIFYNHTTGAKNGSGVLVVTPNNTIAWSESWTPLTDTANERFTIYALQADPTGNIYIAGSYQGPIDLDPTNGTHLCTPAAANHHNIFIIKLDQNGNYIWSKNIESANGQYIFSNITNSNLLGNGNICFSGDFTGMVDFDPGANTQILSATNNSYKPFLLTLDPNGNFVNLQSNDVSGNTNAQSKIISYKLNNAGESYLLYSLGDTLDVDFGAATVPYAPPTKMVLAKYDPTMQLIWSKPLHQNITNANLDTTSAQTAIYVYGEYSVSAVLGNNVSVVSNGFDDIFYEKYDSSGNNVWSRTLGSPDYDYISGVKEYAGSLYLLYSYTGLLNTNTGFNDTTIYAPSRDVALSKLDLAANHLSTQEIKASTALLLKRNGLTLDGGFLNMNVKTDVNTNVDPYNNAAAILPLWNTIGCASMVQWANSAPVRTTIFEQSSFSLYPNPTNGAFTLTVDVPYLLEMYTASGAKLLSQQCHKGLNQIKTDGLPNGTYLMNCTNAQHKIQSKIVIRNE